MEGLIGTGWSEYSFSVMGHANIWFSHPRKYGKGSRSWYPS